MTLSSDMCKTIWVDGKLLDVTEMESNGGFTLMQCFTV